jgi:hypothetical protein
VSSGAEPGRQDEHGVEGGVRELVCGEPHADGQIVHLHGEFQHPRCEIGTARRSGAEVIYVNDNFGRWRSQHDELVGTALKGAHADLVEPVLHPRRPGRRGPAHDGAEAEHGGRPEDAAHCAF